MAKMFYSGEEAATQLGTDESGLKDMVREGKLREFRDGGAVSYKVSDVDALAPAMALETAETADASASATGDIILEAVEDSGLELSPSMSDVISLEDTASGQTASGTAVGNSKEDTVVPSVGVNVFDDDDMDDVDPLAGTAISDLAGLGLEGSGSGSGILDLTRESDDTSLGKDLLSEIYSDEKEGSSVIEMGEATRAGLADTGSDVAAVEVDVAEAFEPEVDVEVDDDSAPVVMRQVVEYGPDAAAKSVTVMMAVGVLVMVVAFLAAAAGVRGLTPSLVETINANLVMCAGGALGVALLASLVVYLVSKRSE